MTAPEIVKEAEVPETLTQSQDKSVQNNIQQQKEPEAQVEQQPKSSKDWDKFREARALDRKRAQEETEKAARAAQEAQALKAALDAILNKPQPSQQFEQEEETEEQRIEKKVAQALAKREKEYEEQRRKREQQEYPSRLVETYTDFNQVCNTENLDYLEYHYPEVASAFKHTPDGFEKWASIYKAVKRFVPNTDSKKDLSKAQKNMQKPQSSSSPGMTTTGNQAPPIRLTEEKKAENYARMRRTMNRLGE